MFTRLQDPDRCVDSYQFDILSQKIEKALFRMSFKTEKGGNPFLFALISSFPHELKLKLNTPHPFTTAATDGKKFYWHPIFLDSLEPEHLVTIMNHESNHVLLDHCAKFIGKDPQVWAIAIDFIVNSIIEYDHQVLKRKPPFPTSVFGNNVTLNRLLNCLDGKISLPKGKIVFTDPSVYKKTAEEVYEIIKEKWNKSPNHCSSCQTTYYRQVKDLRDNKEGDCTDCKGDPEGDSFSPLDGHLNVEIDKEDLHDRILVAAEQAESIEAGSVPAFVKEYIQKLTNPKIDFLDIIKFCLFERSKSDGMKNDWRRIRRRGLATGFYQPTRYSYKPKWLCLLDTSASMSKNDLSYGLSQLKSLGQETNGILVCCDAKVHWDEAVEISDVKDLDQVQIIGRGGTHYTEFFKEFEERFGEEFDAIIVITDGLCGTIPAFLKPKVNVFWVLTRKSKFNPPFGQVLTL